MGRDNGYVLWESRTVVAIGTGFAIKSNNPKTGNMIQIWFIRKDRHPSTAIADGADRAVCFGCPLRRQADGARGCYVRMDPVASIWRKWARGGYRTLGSEEYRDAFAGRHVRFGAYGEPVLMPASQIRAIAGAAAGWTGYTHQWRAPWAQGYKTFLMASCDAGDYREAQAAGWRTFTVSRETLQGQVVCPASAEAGKRTQCADCGLCMGTSKQARSIQIQPHGAGQKYAA